MPELDLESAVSEIHQACESRSRSPYFFIVGAGISAPTIPVASEIELECKTIATKQKRTKEPKSKNAIDCYSHWFEAAWPNAQQRQEYLRKKIEKKLISPAALRLAHLLLNGAAGNLVVTPNFDDFLSKALTLFGQPHIICDHPNTISRISIESDDIKIVHVHGTYWFYDCCNLKGEIAERADSALRTETVTIPSFLEWLLWNRSPIVMGYSGWEGDAIMTALQKRIKSAMGFNIYWFCYKRSDLDSLPPWLRNNQGVRFIAPKAETPSAPVKVEEAVAGDTAAPQALKSGAETFETLPAVRVLDLLNRTFNLGPPPLTETPLEFFADQLTKSVFPDEGGQTEDDFYKFRNVIARIQIADRLLKNDEAKRSEIDHAMENLRNAVRQSAYREAIKIAGQVSQANATVEQLDELLSAASAAAENLADNSPEELEGYEIVCETSATLADRNKITPAAVLKWARALFNQGVTLGDLNRSKEAIDVYDKLVRRFGDSTEPAVREQVIKALFNKGFRLGQLNHGEEELAVYNELLRRFSDAPEPAVRELVAKALFNKCVTLRELNRGEEELAVYDELVRRFGGATEEVVREQVAKALFNKGFRLGQMNRSDEELAAYDELVRRFGDAPEPALRDRVAKALFNKGFRLGQLNRSEEEIATYDELARRFGGPSEPGRVQVAKGLVNKGVRLGLLNRNEEELAVYDEVARLFGDDTEPVVREQVAKALRNRSIALGQLDRSEEGIAGFDELVRRFGDATEPTVREQVAKALVNKGFALGQLKRSEEAIAAYDEVVRRFGDATELPVREQAAKALSNKGARLGKLNRNVEELAVYDEVVRRFGGATEIGLQRLVAEVLLSQAKTLKNTGQPDMAAKKVAEIVQRYGGNADTAIQEFVAEARKLVAESANQQVTGK